MDSLDDLQQKVGQSIIKLNRADKAVVILTTAFTVFLFLDFVFNGRWWLWELLSIVPWFLYLSVWLTLLLASIWRRLFPLMIVFAVLGIYVLSISDFALNFSPPLATSSSEVSLFNWNTEFWDEQESDAFYDLITSQSADVIQLQEALQIGGEVITARDVQESLQQKLGEDYQVVQFGELVSATNLPIVNVVTSSEGAFLRLDLQISETKTVSYYNVHVPVHMNLRLLNRDVWRFLEDMQLRFAWRQTVAHALELDLRRNSLPKVVSGDFNAQTTMRIIDPFLAEYTDAYSSTEFGIPSSIELFGLKAWRIDYVLSEFATPISYREVNPEGFSDHWGQVVVHTID